VREKFLHSDTAAEFLGRHEVLLSALDREHVADHLPGNRQRGAVPISLFQFSRVVRASSGDSLGASLAASISTRWICLFLSLEIGIRITFSAELFIDGNRV
jgi:hypothetical protein